MSYLPMKIRWTQQSRILISTLSPTLPAQTFHTCWMNLSGLSEKAIFTSYFTFCSKNNMRATSITQAGYLFATQGI